MKSRTLSAITALTAAALIALTGCTTAVEPNTPENTAESTTAGENITVESGWVKAADMGMSAAFGEIVNTGTKDVTVVSVTTEASDRVELHETVMNDAGEMAMHEKDGGFTITAGKSFMLEPGANHIMLMGLVKPILAGDEIMFTLTFSDGSTYDFTAPAKDFSGANENYEGGDMDMGGDDE